MTTFLELYNNNQLGGYQLIIPEDTKEYKLDSSYYMIPSGKKTKKEQHLPILWFSDRKIGAIKNNSKDFVTRFWVQEPEGHIMTEYLKIIDFKIPGATASKNLRYYKASDILVEEIPPTFEDKEHKKNLLNEFKDLTQVAKADPPGESNFPFSSEDYHKAEEDFEEQKKRQSSLKHRGGRRGGRRTRRQRRKSKK